MTQSYISRSIIGRVAEIATVAAMAGLTLVPAAMAYNPSAAEASAQEAIVHRLPTVVITAEGATEVTRLETVVVIGKRAS